MRVSFQILVILFFVSGCSPQTDKLTNPEKALISRGAVSLLFGHPVDIVEVDRLEADVIYTAYRRPDDGSAWKHKFRFEGSDLIWGSADGRWRTHPQDEQLSFSIDRFKKNFSVTLTYPDGSKSTKQFSL